MKSGSTPNTPFRSQATFPLTQGGVHGAKRVSPVYDDSAISYLIKSVDEVKDMIDVLSRRVEAHQDSPTGHEGLNQRVISLERERTRIEGIQDKRPLETWQIALGIFGILYSITSLTLAGLGFLLTLFNILHTLHIL